MKRLRLIALITFLFQSALANDWFCSIKNHHNHQDLSLTTQFGIMNLRDHPNFTEDHTLSLGAGVLYHVTPLIGLYVPFDHQNINDQNLYRLGFGLNLRPLCHPYVKLNLFINGNWVRLSGQNKLGLAMGSSIDVGLNPKSHFPIYLGPLFQYDNVFYSPQDIRSYTFGLRLSFLGQTDPDL